MSGDALTPSIMAMGYCALDVVWHDGQVSHSAGGTAANVAANLAYLGWSSTLVARCGADAPARRILNDLRRANVAVDLMERSQDVATPVVLYDVDPPRHRFSFTCRSCGRKLPRYRPISEAHLRDSVLDQSAPAPSVFFFDRASAPAIEAAQTLRVRGARVVFEPSSRGSAALTKKAAGVAHIVKLSHERRHSLDPSVLVARRGQLQIETLGAEGVRYRIGSGRWKKLPTRAESVSDTGGAGDWLTAGLLFDLAPSWSIDSPSTLEAALDRAQALAALSCRFIGARSLSRVPHDIVKRAVSLLLENNEPELPSLRGGSRSRASTACPVCLGPSRGVADQASPAIATNGRPAVLKRPFLVPAAGMSVGSAAAD